MHDIGAGWTVIRESELVSLVGSVVIVSYEENKDISALNRI